MKILFFEDNAQAQKLAIKLLIDEEKHDVYLTDRYTDVIEWLEDKPGANTFGALFIDLNVPCIGMPESLRNEQSEFLSGWIFINEWLVKKYPFLQQRIILYSAYLDLIGDDIKKYHVLNKSDPNIVSCMYDILARLDNPDCEV